MREPRLYYMKCRGIQIWFDLKTFNLEQMEQDFSVIRPKELKLP